jgi:hypothetical protein
MWIIRYKFHYHSFPNPHLLIPFRAVCTEEKHSSQGKFIKCKIINDMPWYHALILVDKIIVIWLQEMIIIESFRWVVNKAVTRTRQKWSCLPHHLSHHHCHYISKKSTVDRSHSLWAQSPYIVNEAVTRTRHTHLFINCWTYHWHCHHLSTYITAIALILCEHGVQNKLNSLTTFYHSTWMHIIVDG